MPLIDWFATSATDCAAWIWFGLLDSSEGFNRRSNKGEDVGMRGHAGKAEVRRRIWEHSMEETDR